MKAALLSLVALVSSLAPRSSGAQPPPEGVAPAAAEGASSAGKASDAPADAPPANRTITGYGYSDQRAGSAEAALAGGALPAKGTRRSGARAAHAGTDAVATLPGFMMLPDGGSRLFVQLTKPVDVREVNGAPAARTGKPAASRGTAAPPVKTLTYAIAHAYVVRRNNVNALETVHFNTPVARAHLAPHGANLHFVLELRAAAVPAWRVVTNGDGSTLQIDFPKGAYVAPDAGGPLPSVLPPSAP